MNILECIQQQYTEDTFKACATTGTATPERRQHYDREDQRTKKTVQHTGWTIPELGQQWNFYFSFKVLYFKGQCHRI